MHIRDGAQVTTLCAWGPNGLRVRSLLGDPGRLLERYGALCERPAGGSLETKWLAGGGVEALNGSIVACVDSGGTIAYRDAESGAELLSEVPQRLHGFPPRHMTASTPGLFRINATFRAYSGERIFGLGQHQHGRLDQKGCVIDLVQHNTEVSIPFLISSRGYGILWNSPGIGRVELAENRTRWTAEAGPQLDYWIVRDSTPGHILGRFADAVGRSPELPTWATGFWQSRMRYENQEELLGIAREYVQRGLPLSAIVVDFLHWRFHGDWAFDAQRWPDPGGMVAELRQLGIELVVSVWPTMNEHSANFNQARDDGLLLEATRGIGAATRFVDVGEEGSALLHFYDPSNPDARRFIWKRVSEGYGRYGIRSFWLDACEPEITSPDAAAWRYFAGDGTAVANMYPLWHAQAFFEGLRTDGEGEPYLLCRSAWAGSQKFGVALWSGDVDSSFEALRAQLPAGLNAGMSGMSWWGSDIGGFVSTLPNDSAVFQELVIRWFQFALFTPLFRLHGHRFPDDPERLKVGAANEVWSFGPEVYTVVRELLDLRERLRPYISREAVSSSAGGLPLMRALFLAFPEDPQSATVDDQFLFGSDVLVAPVLDSGLRQRSVYLPAGAHWTDYWTGEVIDGGGYRDVPAPLARVPFYLRHGSQVEEDLMQQQVAAADVIEHG